MLAPFLTPLKNAGTQFARNQLAAGIRRTGTQTVRNLRNTPPGLKRELGLLGAVSNIPVVQGALVTGGGAAAVDTSNRTGFTERIEDALNKVGPSLDNFFAGITPQSVQQFGRKQEKQGFGAALTYATPFGFLAAPLIPNAQPQVTRRPVANLPSDYKQTELAAGAAAEQYRPGAGFPGQQQAPVVPGASMGNMAGLYEQGRSAAKTQEEMNMVRDLGLAMHAQKYGTPDQRMASTIGARNPLLDRMGLQQPSRPGVFVENPTDEYLQSEVDKKGKEVQDFLKTFNASRGKK